MSTRQQKVYWKSLDERENSPEFRKTLDSEFPEIHLQEWLESTGLKEQAVSRRSFLKATGFSIAGSMLASCARGPVEKAIPLLTRPENRVPGRAVWYASTCAGCNAGCGILVKNRDGRPIKIEGNPEHPLSRGGVCAVGQAMVLGLYDSQRLQQPLIDGRPADWAEIDRAVTVRLDEVKGEVVLLTGTITSPSTRAGIHRFLSRFSSARHVEYDPVSYSAILEAHAATHGRRALPRYFFDRAEVILSVDADFLGTWISPVEFTRAYSTGRTLEGDEPRLSRHIQFEGRLSLTGANADERIKATPESCRAFVVHLARHLAREAGQPAPVRETGTALAEIDMRKIEEIADALWARRGKSLLVCGINEIAIQQLVNFCNHVLGNYGKTLDIDRASAQYRGDDGAVAALLAAMQAGKIGAILIAGVNPVYSLPQGEQFAAALQKVPLSIVFAEHANETTAHAHYVCPLHHPLESWNDAELSDDLVSVAQPALRPFGKTRSLRECLAAWLGEPRDDLELMQMYWRQALYPRRRENLEFQAFWDRAVHDGFAQLRSAAQPKARFRFDRPVEIRASAAPVGDRYALVLYEKISMRDGRHAHSPWLHEMPDPISKAVWDNYLCLAPATAKKLGVREGDVVKISAGKQFIELPVQIQPGQHEQVVAIALGYGRKGTDRFSKIGPKWINRRLTVPEGGTVGRNAFVFVTFDGRSFSFANHVTLEPTGRRVHLALTQTHHTITVPEKLGGHRRNMVRETTLAAYKKDPASGNHFEHEILQLWPQDYKYTGHHWAMAIDLTRCTGCSACVVSCQAENNVPVVGKDEVYRRREMHWIRIDRYYSGEEGDVDVLFQPVMCQHCDHAPCEGVCPVLATVHSDEGINQQIYNRCVGTRYCANNCPYKVRRFNWFDYWHGKRREHLVLNPDITTRSRGVMEKCSLCVQRIQEAKAEAKRRGRPLADGDIKLACEQSCPAGAIVFGDMNDPESRIAKLIANPRHYRMLEEMNFRPTVGYLTKVRHREGDDSETHG